MRYTSPILQAIKEFVDALLFSEDNGYTRAEERERDWAKWVDSLGLDEDWMEENKSVDEAEE